MSDVLYRPRSASEIVDAAFQLLRRHFKAFVSITAVTYVPVLFSTLILQRAYGVTFANRNPSPTYLVAAAIVTVLWYALASGALTAAAADAYAGNPVDAARALRRGARRLPATLAAMLVTYAIIALSAALVAGLGGVLIAVMAGLPPIVIILAAVVAVLLLAVPPLYLLTRWFAVPAAHVIEDVGPIAGMRRSWHLASDAKWRIFGTLALVWIIYLLLGFALVAVALVTKSEGVLQVMNALSSIFVYPLLPVTLTVLYYDARIRREGYDIELLERELGAPPAGAAPPEQPAY